MHHRTGTCVIADDAPHIRALIGKWLTDSGFDCFPVSGAAEALATAERQTPDIVVTDLDMPGGDGLQLLHAIRNHDRADLRDVPVVVISSMIDSDIEHVVRQRGGNAFVSKPIAKNSFLQLFQRALDRSGYCGLAKKQAAGTRSPTFRRLIADSPRSDLRGDRDRPGQRDTPDVGNRQRRGRGSSNRDVDAKHRDN
jgi:two-component system nitrogen regulation response regulator GlnG